MVGFLKRVDAKLELLDEVSCCNLDYSAKRTRADDGELRGNDLQLDEAACTLAALSNAITSVTRRLQIYNPRRVCLGLLLDFLLLLYLQLVVLHGKYGLLVEGAASLVCSNCHGL